MDRFDTLFENLQKEGQTDEKTDEQIKDFMRVFLLGSVDAETYQDDKIRQIRLTTRVGSLYSVDLTKFY